MNTADLAALNRARVLRLFDRAGGRLLAEAALLPFTAADHGSGRAKLAQPLALAAAPGWVELLDESAAVIQAGAVTA